MYLPYAIPTREGASNQIWRGSIHEFSFGVIALLMMEYHWFAWGKINDSLSGKHFFFRSPQQLSHLFLEGFLSQQEALQGLPLEMEDLFTRRSQNFFSFLSQIKQRGYVIATTQVLSFSFFLPSPLHWCVHAALSFLSFPITHRSFPIYPHLWV